MKRKEKTKQGEQKWKENARQKIETLEGKIVTITKILKEDDKRIKRLSEENKKLRINISVMMADKKEK